VFRKSGAVEGVVADVLAAKDRLGVGAIWMQLGVRDDAAAGWAAAAGLAAVMDRCPMIEYPRLFGAAHLSSIAIGSRSVVARHLDEAAVGIPKVDGGHRPSLFFCG
jgi:hypothetical protein